MERMEILHHNPTTIHRDRSEDSARALIQVRLDK